MNILSLTYLGNIQWFAKVCFEECVIDVGEHYIKQSFRNRCEIMTAPAPRMPLVVNVVKGNSRQAVKDVRIDYSKRWQHQHRQAFVSAYSNSPFFDHYWPELEPFFERRYEFLTDLDVGLLETLLRLLGSDAAPAFSQTYIDAAAGRTDLRAAISPKPRLARPDPSFRVEPYWQVFSAVRPFELNLSVVDLLFCEGPQSLDILRRSKIG